MLIEGTDHKIHYIRSSPEIEWSRAQGLLQAESFAILTSRGFPDRDRLQIRDLGSAELLLSDRGYLAEAAKQIGASLPQGVWGGWIGRHDRAVDTHAASLQRERHSDKRSR
jgi:hypothetical protein